MNDPSDFHNQTPRFKDPLDEAIGMALEESALDRVSGNFTERVLAAAERDEFDGVDKAPHRWFGKKVAMAVVAALVIGLWSGTHQGARSGSDPHATLLAGSFVGALRTISNSFEMGGEETTDTKDQVELIADSRTIRAKMEVENVVDEELLALLGP